MKLRVLGVIPARFASSRFPGKALAPILGKPMIQHVYERSRRAKSVDRVLVATDDLRILETVRDFGGEAFLTGDCPTGTDRVAVTAAAFPDYEVVLNIQGDEPLLEPDMLDALVAPFEQDETVVMSTLAERIRDQRDYLSPNVVKVLTDRFGFALYFSRASIPGSRAGSVWDPNAPIFRHVGLYGYRADFLQRLVRLEPTPLEQREGLEQLRALENGYRIYVSITPYRTVGVDTPEELLAVEEILRRRLGLQP
ncbi:MAG: 3-deoxy-manno-octulosonate cytidylyltransferase [Candidatus Poribacteria bacterium]|nr:MAG: 3-deoxy-manno-octulosonate cytidylyltransferase [Candidatus Poribacteria bacterium]